MILLRLLITVVITASISFLLTGPAHAVDHPWDDNKGDTNTIVGSQPNVGDEADETTTPTIVSRIGNWTRLFFLEIKSVLIGIERSDVSVKPPTGRKPKTAFPYDGKK